MRFLRNHWYDTGGVLAIVVIVFLWKRYDTLTPYQFLMWVSLVTLFLHQLEEYRWPGTFPGMVNTAIGKSAHPDNYPLNSNTSFIINVSGWILYFLAALFAEKAIWLGITAIMISIGNFFAHTFLFNIKGKTIYNAGMITTWLFFLPCSVLFIQLLATQIRPQLLQIIIGIILGIICNVLILKTIFWLADPDSKYMFEPRQLLAGMAKR